MAGEYRFDADYVYDDVINPPHPERAQIDVVRVVFGQEHGRKPRHALILTREWVVEGEVERFDGPAGFTLGDGYGADGGIRNASLSRDRFHLRLNAAGIAAVQEEDILVAFDVEDAAFSRLRQVLAEMFAGLDGCSYQDLAP